MSSNGRTRLLTVVAGLLALAGASSIAYSGFLPIPPISDVPTPLAWQASGLFELAAAIGVFRRQVWGRVLGVFVAGVGLVQAVFLAAAQLSTSNAPVFVVGATLALSGACGVFILWVLLRRWPARA